MKAVSGRDLCKIVERHGWTLRRTSGSHHIYAKDAEPAILTIPVHGNRDLRLGTLRRLLRDAGLSGDDL